MNMNRLKADDLELVLRNKRESLVSTIKKSMHRSDDPELLVLDDNAGDVGDWPVAGALNDTQIAMLKTELAELNDIDAALSRIGDGSYGLCVCCGKPISPERMKAQPTAVRCLVCQENSERHRHGH